MKFKRRTTHVPKKKREGFMYGQKCGEPTRSGGTCQLTQGHSGGHKK